MTAASAELNVGVSALSGCVNGITAQAGGWKWRFASKVTATALKMGVSYVHTFVFRAVFFCGLDMFMSCILLYVTALCSSRLLRRYGGRPVFVVGFVCVDCCLSLSLL